MPAWWTMMPPAGVQVQMLGVNFDGSVVPVDGQAHSMNSPMKLSDFGFGGELDHGLAHPSAFSVPEWAPFVHLEAVVVASTSQCW